MAVPVPEAALAGRSVFLKRGARAYLVNSIASVAVRLVVAEGAVSYTHLDVYKRQAYDLLVEGGVEAVKVMPLAAKLGLSRTSFYWHFADREALLAGLVARWQSQNTANLIARTLAPAGSVAEAMLNVTDCWITPALFDSRMEFAIRTWALTDKALAEVLRDVDEVRICLLYTSRCV